MPVGKLRVCYIADTNVALGKVGPFRFEWESKTPLNAWVKATFDLCPDTNPADSVLECDLDLPSGSTELVFTAAKIDPNAPNDTGAATYWWGDWSCPAPGGCGTDNGHIYLSNSKGPVPYDRKQNNAGPLYQNGHVAVIP